MNIWYSISIPIYSVAMHDLTMDIHTFLPLIYHILWHKYDAHVACMFFKYVSYMHFDSSPDLLF